MNICIIWYKHNGLIYQYVLYGNLVLNEYINNVVYFKLPNILISVIITEHMYYMIYLL